MSSAGVQTATHQQPALGSSTLNTTSNRPYASSITSPTVEYHANQIATSSPTSKRPSSRKVSGNTDPHNYEANGSATSRSSAPHHGSHSSGQPDRGGAMLPLAPPRTSSSQHAGNSRKDSHTEERSAHSSSRPPQQDSTRSGTRPSTMENGNANKRAAESHFAQDLTGRPNENRDNRGTSSLPVRTHNGTQKQPREPTENVNKHANTTETSYNRDSRSGHHHSAQQQMDVAAATPIVPMNNGNEERRGGRSRHDYSRQPKATAKFGDFILGNTIGEGEFGKVKLGWKQDSSVQVAIKLIKRDTVGGNPSRLAKIRREVTILRGLHHPNIVQLIDMVETDRYIGIILEYASGGELFDYILNHRYLKDQAARRLFAQLVSGVGYLHKKGIVHRDLKLENLLLDRNRNIIITDFGFANTFDANEELAEEEELNLSDRDFVKRAGLDRIKGDGTRKGDLMQTSCGSPCYAAPELVVSDCLYTGRKVDVWSCGVILYAMLAGYLPFDDDPANPEGDNINLLYKYIVTTPLTFPEYVTPHARDLLRRILVPNPRKRADLFEVARHSWLSEYAHVVEFITSSTTLPADVQNLTSAPDEHSGAPMVARSNSVRDAHKPKVHSPPTVGGLAKAHGKIDTGADSAQRTTTKEAKRRTVQVEYVAPTTQTQRGEDAYSSKSGNRPASTSQTRVDTQAAAKGDKPLPREPHGSRDALAREAGSRNPPVSHPNASSRIPRDTRAGEHSYIPRSNSVARPQTGGSITSAVSMGLGHYGQPAPPTVADTNVEGRIHQPQSSSEQFEGQGRPSTSVMPSKFSRMSGMAADSQSGAGKGHKRSSTIGEIGSKLLGRSGSVFGQRKKRPEQLGDKSKKYPPISMANAMPAGEEPGRVSTDSKVSRRSFSLGLGKKRSGSITGSQGSGPSGEKDGRRRFSLLPASFSLKSLSLGGGNGREGTPPSEIGSQHTLPIQDQQAEAARSFTSHGDARGSGPMFGPDYNNNRPPVSNSHPPRHHRFASAQLDNRKPTAIPQYLQTSAHYGGNPKASMDMSRPPTSPQLGGYQTPYSGPEGYGTQSRLSTSHSRNNRVVLQKNDKRFNDAYEQDYRGHDGSSGAAKRVMEFFRRRAKTRGGEER